MKEEQARTARPTRRRIASARGALGRRRGTHRRSLRVHYAVRALVISLGLFSAGNSYATPVISEVLYDAVGSDNGQSFVEIYGVGGTVLDGLTLEGVNGSNGAVGPVIALTGVIPVDGVFVVADVDTAGVSLVTHIDQLANFDFQNGPDSIVLMNGAVVIDAVGYGVFGAGEIFAGEGDAALDGPAGTSLARQFADVDTDDNALDFVVLGAPTPGTVALLSVPEPGSGLLAAAGLIGLAARRRVACTRMDTASRRSRVSKEVV